MSAYKMIWEKTPLHIAIAEHGEDSRMVRLLRANESTWQMIKRWPFAIEVYAAVPPGS